MAVLYLLGFEWEERYKVEYVSQEMVEVSDSWGVGRGGSRGLFLELLWFLRGRRVFCLVGLESTCGTFAAVSVGGWEPHTKAAARSAGAGRR
jgi:hypothetical protein